MKSSGLTKLGKSIPSPKLEYHSLAVTSNPVTLDFLTHVVMFNFPVLAKDNILLEASDALPNDEGFKTKSSPNARFLDLFKLSSSANHSFLLLKNSTIG